jgi:hypothetical protein
MTNERHLERDLPAILDEIATGRYPDYIDDVLTTTARSRQRPAWMFPERWLPVELVTTRVPTTRVPWRQIGVLALLALLIAVAVIGYIGTQQPRLPAPFGRAANGVIAYSAGGDIFTADPVTGAARAIVAGPDTDIAPRFSPSGTHVVFERKLKNGPGQLYVARSDGSGLTLITPEPVHLAVADSSTNYEFAPDGQSILFMSSKDGLPIMSIARADGGGVAQIDVPMAAERASFRPPDGAEILFLSPGLQGHGIYVVDRAGGAPRAIVKPVFGMDLTGAAWSPDGTHILYWSWDNQTAEGQTARTHVISSDGTGDVELPGPPDAVWNAVAAWSNDGTRIFLVRGYTGDNEDVRPVVLPADGGSPGVEIPFPGSAEQECCSSWIWSPDDSKIFGRPGGVDGASRQVILDPVAGTSSDAPWDSMSDPTWQRVAP